MRPAFSLAGAAIAVMMLVSGCVQGGTDVVPPPAANADPVFASDEDALAAATEAYKAYLAMSDLIAQEGGVNPERIAPFVTEEWLPKELNGFNAFLDKGRHQVGTSIFENAELQQIEDSVGYTAVSIYVCHDASGVEIYDANNNNVTPPILATPWLAQVVFEMSGGERKLLLAGNDPWVQDQSC